MKSNNDSSCQANVLTRLILDELVNEFGKTKEQASKLILASEVKASLLNNPIGFHDTPYDWAVIILTDQEDYDTLAKCLH